jgi:formate C-acetyltransferase
VIDGELKNTNGAGEISVGLGTILLQKGFNGIKRDAEGRLKELDLKNPEDIDKIYFLRAVIKVCDGAVLYGRRCSELAGKLAEQERDDKRRKELERIAETCKRVPGEPAGSFQEALQSVWFGQVALFLEENAPSYSPGRVDQYLYPFLKQDLDSGAITEEEARELICCWLIRYAEIPWLLSQFVSLYYAGYMGFQNMNLGGQTRDGKDATNDLSYMILDCVKNLRMYQPSLSVRVHNNSPQEFLLKVAEVIRTGIGFPAVHFDDTSIKMMLSYGASLEDARDYCVLGCVEPSIHGKLSQWSACCLTNFPIAVEFALSNGVQLVSGKKLGLETGDPRSFQTFEAFEAAVKEQFKYLIRVSAISHGGLRGIGKGYHERRSKVQRRPGGHHCRNGRLRQLHGCRQEAGL